VKSGWEQQVRKEKGRTMEQIEEMVWGERERQMDKLGS
jgi:hypothetical protein